MTGEAATCDLICFLIFESLPFVFDNEFLILSISKGVVYSKNLCLIMLLFANNYFWLRFEVSYGAKEVFILFGDRCDHRLFSKCP
jgi:hypothetical protein